MEKLLTSAKIYVKQSSIHLAGRGVFARCDIKKNEIIETCPMIELSKHDTSNVAESALVTYFFYFGKKKERVAIVLGFGSLYNHSYTPNATFFIRQKENLIDFTALHEIKNDEEITFNYHNDNKKENKKSPLWFEI
jgi:uncharacterized protein